MTIQIGNTVLHIRLRFFCCNYIWHTCYRGISWENLLSKYKLLLCWARSSGTVPFSDPLVKEDASALSDDQLRWQLAILHWVEYWYHSAPVPLLVLWKYFAELPLLCVLPKFHAKIQHNVETRKLLAHTRQLEYGWFIRLKIIGAF